MSKYQIYSEITSDKAIPPDSVFNLDFVNYLRLDGMILSEETKAELERIRLSRRKQRKRSQ